MGNLNIYDPFSVDASRTDALGWKKFLNRVNELSEPLKNTLISSETDDTIYDISINFNFSESQTADLSRIIRDILLADVFVGDMVNEIQKRLQVDSSTANQIGQVIVSDLFVSAMEEIKQMHKQKFRSKPLEAPTKRQFSNPAASLDINKNNVLDLRNKE